jgi:predicted Ser/Thr protein kinase
MERYVLPPGTELGGYILGAAVGSGGMGTVYRSMDADGRTVALKLIHAAAAQDPAARARLQREVQLLQRLRSPGIARILDAEIDSAEAFVVTEYIEGESLDKEVRRDGAYTLAELAALAASLAATLGQVHAAGIIHRDLKPGNIMLGEAGPILIDFGIAQESQATRLTGTGLVIGTPGYVAPELIAGEEPTPKTDEWGLAAVLTFAATARPPFGEGRFDVVLGRVAQGAADLDGLPPPLVDALTWALAPDPARRLAAWDLADALAAAADGRPIPTVPVTTPTRTIEPARRAAGPEPSAAVTAWAPEPQPRSAIAEPGPAPLPPRAPRGGVVLALWFALAATATLNLSAGIVLIVLMLVGGRTVGIAGEMLRGWRMARGPRAADGARIVAATPWALVRAAVGLVPPLALGALVGVGGHLLASRAGLLPAPLALGGAVALGALTAWLGPGGRLTRRGVAAIFRWTMPGPKSAWGVAIALLGWAALVALGWRDGSPWDSPLP